VVIAVRMESGVVVGMASAVLLTIAAFIYMLLHMVS
jgi:hypothetical protein